MVKLTPQLLKQLEEVFQEIGYTIRYEKGNFKSGYCILETRKVVVLNKFSVVENRIITLMEILKYLGTMESFDSEKYSAFCKKHLKEEQIEAEKEVI
jgi:hypothetical protein